GRHPSTERHLAVVVILHQATDLLSSDSQPLSLRLAAVRLLSHVDPAFSRDAILKLLLPQGEPELRREAVRAISRLNDAELSRSALTNLKSYTAETRRQIIAESAQCRSLGAALL